MIYNIFFKKSKGGFIVLTMVLLVNVVVLAVASGIFLRSIGQVNESSDTELSLKAWSTVIACGEYALNELASSTDTTGWSYAGDYSLPVGDQTCYIYGIETTGDAGKVIKASSTVSNFTRKIQIEASTNTPKVLLTSWEEVADF